MLIRYFSEDDGQPQGGGGDDGKARGSDMLDRYGRDALKLAEKLAEVQSENYTLREQRRELKRQLTEANGKAPADGARILSADEAAAYDAYAALGKPSDVKAALDAKNTAEQRLTTMERDATLRDVRDATGFDLDILRDIGGAEWQYQIKDETVDDKPQRVVYVKDGDTEQRIDQHPKVVKFLPALKPAATPPQPSGTTYPQQSAGGTAPKLSPAAAYINRAYSKDAK